DCGHESDVGADIDSGIAGFEKGPERGYLVFVPRLLVQMVVELLLVPIVAERKLDPSVVVCASAQDGGACLQLYVHSHFAQAIQTSSKHHDLVLSSLNSAKKLALCFCVIPRFVRST